MELIGQHGFFRRLCKLSRKEPAVDIIAHGSGDYVNGYSSTNRKASSLLLSLSLVSLGTKDQYCRLKFASIFAGFSCAEFEMNLSFQPLCEVLNFQPFTGIFYK